MLEFQIENIDTAEIQMFSAVVRELALRELEEKLKQAQKEFEDL